MSDDEKREQHIIDTLQNYWDSKLAGRDFPEEEDINQRDIADIWESCFLVEMAGGKFYYSLAGENILEAYADEGLEGKEITEDLLYPESPGIVDMLIDLKRGQEKLHYEGSFINKNNMDIKFRKLLLPLGTNGEVTHIIGTMRWKAF